MDRCPAANPSSRLTALTVVALLGFAAGCSGETSRDRALADAKSQHAELTLTQQSADPEVRNQVARIVADRQTAADLDRSSVTAADNAALPLLQLYSDGNLRRLLRRTGRIIEDGVTDDPDRVADMRAALAANAKQRSVIHDALRRPLSDFQLDYTAGLLAVNSQLDVAELCARLLVFEVIVALAEDDPSTAADAFWAVMKLAGCLADEPHLAARLQAAFIRASASDGLHYLVNHPLVSTGQLVTVHEVITSHLADWTPDRHAWIGDRAAALQTYEMARAGELLSLLAADEIEEFTADGRLEQYLGDRRREIIDADQRFYLRWIDQIIAACEKPYHVRRELLESIRQHLHNRRTADDYPLIAARILFADIQRGHEIQARDRELFEAWDLALAYALDRPAPPYEISPLSGREYLIADADGFTEVTLFSPIRDNRVWSIIVPWPTPPQIDAARRPARYPR